MTKPKAKRVRKGVPDIRWQDGTEVIDLDSEIVVWLTKLHRESCSMRRGMAAVGNLSRERIEELMRSVNLVAAKAYRLAAGAEVKS